MDLDPLAVVRRRLREQNLAGAPLASPADVVRRLGAMQAQEFAEAKWSLAERLEGWTEAGVEAAFARGEIVRTHVLRPTWHFVAPEDLRWLLRLSAPRVHAANRYWYGQAGLDPDLLARTLGILARALDDGAPRTRAELAAALAGAGIAAEGPRLAYVLMHAELEALICSGPRRGRQHTYALLDRRVPAGPDLPREAALAELTLRYFSSHGPATAADFSWWSGLTLADARLGLELAGDRLERHAGEDGTAWVAGAQDDGGEARERCAFLVPMYDETVVAYKDLRVVLAYPLPREGALSRPVVVDGRTVGSWSRTLSGRTATVHATLFGSLEATEMAALRAAADRFGAFLERPVTLEAAAA